MTNRTRRTAVILICATLGLGLAGCAPEPGTDGAAPTPAPTASAAPKPDAEQSPEPEAAAPAPPKLEQAELDRRLRDAAWANDVSAFTQLLEWGADVNAADETVQSAYLITTSEGRLELLELALDNGANVKALDSWDGTGLIRAAERGHWDISGALIRAGVDLNHVNNLGYQAIHEAVWLGRDDPTYHATLRVLIAGGSAVDTLSLSEGLTPLQMAEERGFEGQATVLRALVGAPAPADPVPALLTAASAGDVDGVVLALRAGADPATKNVDGVSVRELAERGGHAATAQVLRALGG